MERLSWIIQGTQCNHKDPYKEKGELGSKRRYDDGRRGWSKATDESEPWAKEWGQLLEAGKGKEQILPLRLQKQCSTSDLFQNSDLQNWKIKSLCCFKQPNQKIGRRPK